MEDGHEIVDCRQVDPAEPNVLVQTTTLTDKHSDSSITTRRMYHRVVAPTT